MADQDNILDQAEGPDFLNMSVRAVPRHRGARLAARSSAERAAGPLPRPAAAGLAGVEAAQ